MNAEKPNYVRSGEPARLIPVVADTSREQRAASALLATLSATPELANALLQSAGRSVGKTAKIQCWTEIVFTEQPKGLKDRPDGLIVVRIGGRTWSALVEAKIGNQTIDPDQVERYAELAKDHKLDAVITISNQFVARADHHPVRLPKRLTNKVGLFHWSWMWVLTQANLLEMDNAVEDSERNFLLSELIRYLSHESTGVSSFSRMNKDWKDIVTTVRNGGALNKTAPEVEETVASWHQEERDLCLIMARHLGSPVKLKISRQHRDDPAARLKEDCQILSDKQKLVCELQIPDAASDITVCADLQRRTVSCSMELDAPADRKSTKARINWLLRQISETEDPNIHIRAKWPGRASDTMATLNQLREDPDEIQGTNERIAPRGFEVLLIKDIAGKFSGTRTFIDNLEEIVPRFYDEVGQHLRQWQAPPPKPRKQPEVEQDASDDGDPETLYGTPS